MLASLRRRLRRGKRGGQRTGSEEVFQVSPSIDDSDDLDGADRTLVGVGVGFVEDEIRVFDEDAHGRANVRSALTKAWIAREHLDIGLEFVEDSIRCGRVVEGDEAVDVEGVDFSLRRPGEPNRHMRVRLGRRRVVCGLCVSRFRSLQLWVGHWLFLHPTTDAGGRDLRGGVRA